ncbi:MAG: hypothetical protein ACLGIF_06820 [Actinomycetes bacterium]
MHPSRAVAGLTLAAAAALLTACTTPTTPTGPATPSDAAPPPTASSPTGAPSPTSTRSPAPSTVSPTPIEAPRGVVLEITIADGQVAPNGEKVEVARGQRVTLSVTSDIDDALHVHTAGDGYTLPVRAGKTTEGAFVAADRGSFEVESHELEKIIVIVNVR